MSSFTRNVLLFGSTGCGKSSIVNMLSDSEKAVTSSGAKGCTFKNEAYDVTLDGDVYTIFDTTGMDEGTEATVKSADALASLYKLIDRLSDGINLLAFVMRGPRITEHAEKNYSVFYEGICEKKVPIVIIITGMENEDPMDAWWEKNETHFVTTEMLFDGHACITATRGKMTNKGYKNEFEYQESQDLVRELIRANCRNHGWKMEKKWWYQRVWAWLSGRFRSVYIPADFQNFYDTLSRFMRPEDAKQIIDKINH
ncbi:hypothetical protein VKT23_013787 [Stygiomarasmius scandens]|uniref:G domain-containing protein n=1 Tax=Marasmiellus scandens TaxID=2682957 RepID=A0ABR1J6A6_9AGAR